MFLSGEQNARDDWLLDNGVEIITQDDYNGPLSAQDSRLIVDLSLIKDGSQCRPFSHIDGTAVVKLLVDSLLDLVPYEGRHHCNCQKRMDLAMDDFSKMVDMKEEDADGPIHRDLYVFYDAAAMPGVKDTWLKSTAGSITVVRARLSGMVRGTNQLCALFVCLFVLVCGARGPPMSVG